MRFGSSMRVFLSLTCGVALVSGLVVWPGCGGFFNPAFVNSVSGGVFPITPGPEGDFVLVRGLNQTGQNVEFIVTVERLVLVPDDEGNPQVDDEGNLITQSVRNTVRLQTGATGSATDMGVLFPCNMSPVTLIGLGEDFLPSDAAIFVSGQDATGAEGFGVSAPNLNPLSLDAGNFACGDTIVFQAFQSNGVPGGVGLQSFRLAGSSQPSIFEGPNTFVNYQEFLQTQIREEDP